MKDICGVYSLVNLATGERYIGSSINILERCKEHFRQLKTGRHKNRLLLAAYQQHGRDAFAYEILKEDIDEASLARWEQHYIDRLRPVYNQIDIVERHTDTIARIQQWLREQLADGQTHIASEVILRARQRGMKKRTVQYVSKQLQVAGEMTCKMIYKPERRWLWQRRIEQEVQEYERP